MIVFLKLYLAHLIADFILQFGELYRLKLKSRLGHFLHVVIHTIVSLLVVFSFLGDYRLWLFILAVSCLHYFQDICKYRLQERYPQYGFVLFVGDQILHGLVIASVLLFPFSRTMADLQADDPAWPLYGIAFILATFGGSYLLHSFRKNYISQTRSDHFITSAEMSHSLIERPLIAGTFIFAPPLFWILAPVAGVLRLFSPKLRNRLDFSLSFSYAALLGLVFRLWLP